MSKKSLPSFYDLQPEDILSAVEKLGFEITGRCLQLNSYENRVFEIELESKEKIIVKFYRPQRWSKQAILEEFDFLEDLKREDFPVTCPHRDVNGERVFEQSQIYYACFPKIFGRMPDELLEPDLKKIGRRLAQLHSIGEQKSVQHRQEFSAASMGDKAIEILEDWVRPEMRSRYFEAAHSVLDALDQVMADTRLQRIHGDCHRGNLLNDGKNFFFVDFDDFGMGPVAQDIWMLAAGMDEAGLNDLLSGYEELRVFPKEQLAWLELLRGLRIIHYASWIAKRWSDPSFPRLFPQFETSNYWAEETEALERIAWQNT